MTREEAKEIISTTFGKDFDRENFLNFIRKLFRGDFQARTLRIKMRLKGPYGEMALNCEKVAEYRLKGQKLDVLIVNFATGEILPREFEMAQGFLVSEYLRKKIFQDSPLDGVLIAFVPHNSQEGWKFSLGIPSSREAGISSVRVFSFLGGKDVSNQIPVSRFLPLLVGSRTVTLKTLLGTFSYRRFLREFFEDYVDLLLRTESEVAKLVALDSGVRSEFESRGITPLSFSNRLLQQVVILHFLQERGWLGVSQENDWGTGPKDFLRRLFRKEFCDYGNFFDQVLKPLLYGTLSGDRSSEGDFCLPLGCKIPFLGEYLFQPVGGYNWSNTSIPLPNDLFSSDGGNDGIFDVLGKYAFSLQEEYPWSRNLAVTVEVARVVFEEVNRLLRRKGNRCSGAKGVARTASPLRLESDNSCVFKKALISYLVSRLKGFVSRKSIERFVFNSSEIYPFVRVVAEVELLPSEESRRIRYSPVNISGSIISSAARVDKLLGEVKVCVVGVELGGTLLEIASEIAILRDLILPWVRRNTRVPGFFKRVCIENSLYGVSDEPEVVDACKTILNLGLIAESARERIPVLPDLSSKIICKELTQYLEAPSCKVGSWKIRCKARSEFSFIKESFPDVFKGSIRQQPEVFCVTWGLHRCWRRNISVLPESFENDVAKILSDRIRQKGYRVVSFRVLRDQVQLILSCCGENLHRIIGDLKGYSSYTFHKLLLGNAMSSRQYFDCTGGRFKLWSKGYQKASLRGKDAVLDPSWDVGISIDSLRRNGTALGEVVSGMSTPVGHSEKGGFDIVMVDAKSILGSVVGEWGKKRKSSSHPDKEYYRCLYSVGLEALREGGILVLSF